MDMNIPPEMEGIGDLNQDIEGLANDMDSMAPEFNKWTMNGNPVLDDPGFNDHDRTQMWQQNNYMPASNGARGGSGYNSGYNTPGGRTDGEGNFIRNEMDSCSGSVYQLDSIPQSETSSVHSSASGVADPKVFIPEFIKTMQENDQDLRDHCLEKISKFCRTPLVLNAVTHSKELVEILIGIMNKASEDLFIADPKSDDFKKIKDRAKATAEVMKCMSGSLDGRKGILLCNGMNGLMGFLQSPVDVIMHIAITTLHNIILTQNEKDSEEKAVVDQAIKIIKTTGQGVSALTNILNRPEGAGKTTDQVDKLRAIVIDCLRMLSTGDNETKLIIFTHNVPRKLVEILRTKQGYKNLILVTTKLLKVLTVCPKNKSAIIQVGGLDALAIYLTNENEKIRKQCILTIRNLSDKATPENISDSNGLIRTLVEMLAYYNEDQLQIQTVCAANILHNLACNNPTNKIAICRANGLSNLVHVIGKYGTNKRLLGDVVDALRSIIGGHEQSDVAHSFLLRETKIIEILIHHLEWHMHPGNFVQAKGKPQGPYWPSIKSILELLNNLSQKPQNQEVLREKMAINEVKNLFCFVTKTYLIAPTLPPEDIRLVIQICLSCLWAMSKDKQNREVLRDGKFLQIMVDDLLSWIWSHQAESYKNIIVILFRTLYELSCDPFCARFLLNNTGINQYLMKLASGNNNELSKLVVGMKQNLSYIQDDIKTSMGPSQSMDHFNNPMSNQMSHIITNNGNNGQQVFNQNNRFSGPPPIQGMQYKNFDDGAMMGQSNGFMGQQNLQPPPPSFPQQQQPQPPQTQTNSMMGPPIGQPQQNNFFFNEDMPPEFTENLNFPQGQHQINTRPPFPPDNQGFMNQNNENQFFFNN